MCFKFKSKQNILLVFAGLQLQPAFQKDEPAQILLLLLQPDAKDRFMACKTAYQTLVDEGQRRQYDRTLEVTPLHFPGKP